MLLQQYSGINAVNMFAGTILADGGVDDPQEAAIWLALTHCVSTPICMLTSDRCGRRALLGLSAAGMALAPSRLRKFNGSRVRGPRRLQSFAFALGCILFVGMLETMSIPDIRRSWRENQRNQWQRGSKG